MYQPEWTLSACQTGNRAVYLLDVSLTEDKMGRIRSFKLAAGTRIGNYEIVRPIGRGWEGEVFEVREVPTEATRAMKIVRHEPKQPTRDRIAAAWFFEQLADTGSVARYYHMGQWFFDDSEGVFFYVFEHLRGEDLSALIRRQRARMSSSRALELLTMVVACVARIHERGYAVGDLETGENLIVLDNAQAVKVCDCNPGKADRPNVDFRNDFRELRDLARKIFGRHSRSSAFRDIDANLRTLGRRQNRRYMTELHGQLIAAASTGSAKPKANTRIEPTRR